MRHWFDSLRHVAVKKQNTLVSSLGFSVKNTRLALVITSAIFTCSPALAASVTMLQFGSFETREEAEKRLNEIKGKYAGQVAGLETSVREVKLPPDNLTVYRTQAGPVANRAAAQTVCSKFASAGDECYIVQTAMVKPDQNTAVATNTTSLPTAVLPAPAASNAASAATLQSQSAEGLSSVEIPPLKTDARATVMAAAPVEANKPAQISADMKAALDKAASEQEAVSASVDQAVRAENDANKPSRGFWSRLNPFNADEAPAATLAPVTQTPEVIAAPVEAVVSQPIAQPVVMAAAPVAVAVPVVAPEPVPVPMEALAPAAAPIVEQQPVIMNTMPVMQPEPMRLPPPPAPLMAQAPQAARVPAPEAIAVSPIAPPVANGLVNVEEAKRVPLTHATNAPLVAPVPQRVPVAPVQPPVSLSPNATNGQKTIWAQIGPFANNEAALNFWANYRQVNPDFPVVRVRVTTPYQQHLQGSSQSWLRIGPVTKMGFVNSLCASINPPEPQKKPSGLRCGHIADLGIASSTQRGFLPGSRYQR